MAPTTRPSTDHRRGANRHGDRALAGEFLDREQDLLLADRRIHLDVDQVGLPWRQARFASSDGLLARTCFFSSASVSDRAVAQEHRAEEALETQDKISPLNAFDRAGVTARPGLRACGPARRATALRENWGTPLPWR